MAAEKIDVLLIGPEKPVIAKGLNSTFNVVKLPDANAREKFSRIRRRASAAWRWRPPPSASTGRS